MIIHRHIRTWGLVTNVFPILYRGYLIIQSIKKFPPKSFRLKNQNYAEKKSTEQRKSPLSDDMFDPSEITAYITESWPLSGFDSC